MPWLLTSKSIMMSQRDRERSSRTFKSHSPIRLYLTTSSASLMPPSLHGPRTSLSTLSTTNRCSRLSQISRRPKMSSIRKLRRCKILRTSSPLLRKMATMKCSAPKLLKILSSLRSTVPFITIRQSAQRRHSRSTLALRRAISRTCTSPPLTESKALGSKVQSPTRVVFLGEFDEFII